jgi:hypothetical protein
VRLFGTPGGFALQADRQVPPHLYAGIIGDTLEAFYLRVIFRVVFTHMLNVFARFTLVLY